MSTAGPSILLAETNPTLREAIPALVQQCLPGVRLDRWSPQECLLGEVNSRFNTVITSVHLPDVSQWFLKQNRGVSSYVPVIITTGAVDTEAAFRALEQRALDLITAPFNADEAVRTIRMALWHRTLVRLLHSQDKAIEQCRQHMAAYPGDARVQARFERNLEAVQKTLSTVEKTLDVVEASDLAMIASDVEKDTRARARARLSALCKEGTKSQHLLQPTTRVLFIEDKPQDLEAWSKALGEISSGYSIVHARGAEEGLQICRDQPIDCIVVDLDLGDSSGFEVLVKVRPHKSGEPKIPVVVLTRLPTPYLLKMARQEGAEACLVKQRTSPQQLDEVIQKAVASGPRQSQ